MKNLYEMAVCCFRKTSFIFLLLWSASSNAQEIMRSNLYAMNSGNQILLDGNLTQYGNYSNAIDVHDALKMTNPGINFGIFRDQTNLVIERRSVFLTCDTTLFRMWNMPQGDYRIRFILRDLDHSGMFGYLKDGFLNSFVQVALNDTTNYDFSINGNSASAAQLRFQLFYSPLPLTPIDVNITAISAQRKGNNIAIDWKVVNEELIQAYTVEHSADGRRFTGIKDVAALNTPTAKTYSFNDTRDLKSVNFYRIKAQSTSGKIQYSAIARVNGLTSENSVTIYPNPIVQKSAQLQFSNMKAGIYQLLILHANGKQQHLSPITLQEGSCSVSLKLPQSLSPGIYQLQISGPANIRVVKSIQVL